MFFCPSWPRPKKTAGTFCSAKDSRACSTTARGSRKVSRFTEGRPHEPMDTSAVARMSAGSALDRPILRPAAGFVRQYAAHYRVPPELIGALIDVESRWNPRAVSNKGAMGLMQLMPATAKRFGAFDPFNSRTEHRGGHALRHGADVGVPRRSAPGYRSLLRGRPRHCARATGLSQSGCCGLRAGGPKAVHVSQVSGREAVKEVNPMKLRWIIPVALLIPLRLSATDTPVGARVATITINPREVTVLHLRPEFESTIRMPEEITSVILGSPGEFKAEHNEGEPEYVYVKPITKEAAQSNLLIATKSGQHVTLELVSDGAGVTNQSQPVDFLIEYRASRSFLIAGDSAAPAIPTAPGKEPNHDAGGGDVTTQAPHRFQVSTRSSSSNRKSMLPNGRSGRTSRSRHRSATCGSGATRR